MGEKVRQGKDLAMMSKKLATIITSVPVNFHEGKFLVKEVNKEALKEIFSELEFRTIGKRILGEDIPIAGSADKQGTTVQGDLFGGSTTVASTNVENANEEENTGDVSADKNINNTPHQYELIDSPEKIDQLISSLHNEKEICFDTETTGLDANQASIVGMSFSVKEGTASYVACPEDKNELKKILDKFIPLFNNSSIIWIGQNLKYDLLILKNIGIELAGNIFDTMLAHYVIEPEGKRSMDLLSAKYLGYETVKITELIGKKGKNQGNMRDVEIEKIKEYAGEDADITLQLKNIFTPELKKKEVEKIFNEVESPLVKVLANMEFEGVRVDTDFLKEYSKELDKEAKIAEEAVYKTAGVRFNLASPKQLGEVLFEKLMLDPKAKKTKTGQYATGEDVLQKLAHQFPIVSDILAFRELTKLKSTYVDALPLLINPKTGRVHTTYAQAVAVTGRLSSTNPNLQNIPVRSDRGKEIRKAFIPRDNDHVLISADYSQIELRIVAAISGDTNMCDAFKMGKDIHTATAAKVYGVNEEDVTKEMRYKAKSVNFGIIYGQGAFGLAENLAISRTEAKTIIDNYKKEFPGITHYMESTIQFAKDKGYVETLMGRKRWLRDINSSNFTVRGFAERNAINSPIQGSAADMVKLAMIKVHHAIINQKLKSKMILQVHDELIFDTLKSEAEEMKSLIIENMENALQLPNNVPVIAEAGIGENWLVAH